MKLSYLSGENTEELTPFRTFNRRRNYLVWLFSDKFDFLFSEEQKLRRNKAEDFIFKTSLGLKMLSLCLFMQLRFWRRPAGRSYAFDLGLIYFGTYAFLGSYIPGVYLMWPEYMDLV